MDGTRSAAQPPRAERRALRSVSALFLTPRRRGKNKNHHQPTRRCHPRDLNESNLIGWEDSREYIKVLFGETQSIIRHAEAAVVNSGTASLETVLFNTPQVVGYITNPLTYRIAKKIVKIRYISLGNLIADRLAFKEFIQDDCNADKLTEEVRSLIEDRSYRDRMLKDYSDIRNALGGSGASAAVARSMINVLKGQS